MKEMRDIFLLQCYLGIPLESLVDECDLDFYIHAVGMLLHKAGIAKDKKGFHENNLLLAQNTYLVNTALCGHVLPTC